MRLIGSLEDLRAAREAIADAALPVLLTEPAPRPSAFLARTTYRHVELFEIVVSIVSGVASSGIYEAVKALVAKLQKERPELGDVVVDDGEDELPPSQSNPPSGEVIPTG